MAGGLLPQPKQLIQDNAWNPGIAYQLYTYEPASLTPKATYQDAALTIANTNPVVANARGEVVMYGSGSHRIILKDSLGNTIWDRDNIDALVGGTALQGAGGAAQVGYDDTTLDVMFKSRLGRVVGSIGALRSLNKTKNTQAFATGYYAQGDGGGGPYYYDAADTTTADNGGTVIVAADGGRWKLVVTGEVSVRQFGAKGDGTTNDTAAINAAIASFGGGGAVFVPTGSYLVTSVVMKPGVSLIGAGKLASKIFTNTATQVITLNEINTYGVVISDLWIYGATGSTALYIASTPEQSAHMRLTDLRIENHSYGIDGGTSAFAMFDSLLQKVDFLSCTAVGANFAGSQTVCDECTFRLCGTGAQIHYQNGNSIGGVKFYGCTWIQNTNDVLFDGVVIRSCLFSSCWFEGSKNLIFGTLTAGSQFHQSFIAQGCVFQPGATSVGTGIFGLNNVTGAFEFSGCCAYNNLYAAATLPEASDARFGGSTMYKRLACYKINGAGAVTPLSDCTNTYPNFVNVMKFRVYANDATAASGGLVQGDMYYNSGVGALSLKN